MNRITTWATLGGFVLLACGQIAVAEDEPDDAPGASKPWLDAGPGAPDADRGDAARTYPDAGPGEPNTNEADNAALAACTSHDPCPELTAQRIEPSTPFGLFHAECVLAALRDRRPGVYHVELNSTWTSAYHATSYTMVIGASGEVELGALEDGQPMSTGGPHHERVWRETKRCAPRSREYFENCVQAARDAAAGASSSSSSSGGVDASTEDSGASSSGDIPPNLVDSDALWQCVYPYDAVASQALPWFERCDARAPQCD